MSINEIEETDYELLTKIIFDKKKEQAKVIDAFDYFGATRKE